MKPRYTVKNEAPHLHQSKRKNCGKLRNRNRVSVADIVRECVDKELPRLKERLRKRKTSTEHRRVGNRQTYTPPCIYRDTTQRGKDKVTWTLIFGNSRTRNFYLTTRGSRPTAVAKDPYPAVPAELKALPQWVLWKARDTQGQTHKRYPNQASVARTLSPATADHMDRLPISRHSRADRQFQWHRLCVFRDRLLHRDRPGQLHR